MEVMVAKGRDKEVGRSSHQVDSCCKSVGDESKQEPPVEHTVSRLYPSRRACSSDGGGVGRINGRKMTSGAKSIHWILQPI